MNFDIGRQQTVFRIILDISSFIPAISFILYIVFTIFGLYQSKKEKIRWSFILYMFVMALWSFGSFMMHANTGLGTPIFWYRFMVVGMLGGPITIFHSMLNFSALGELTVQKIVDTFNLEWALMVVLDYATRNYKLIAHSGLTLTGEEAGQFILKRDSSFVKAFIKDSSVLLKQNEEINLTLTIPNKTIDLTPSLVLPLRFKERVNGCIVLGEAGDKDYYDQFDLETLEILAGQCSITLENAISFERLKKQQKRLQNMNKELTISRNKLEAFFDGITTPITVNYAATSNPHV